MRELLMNAQLKVFKPLGKQWWQGVYDDIDYDSSDY